MQTLSTRIAQIVARCSLAGFIGLTTVAQATTLSSEQLAGVPGGSGSFTFNTADALLTVTEDVGASMRGSDLFAFDGLWLGSDNTGGGYAFQFNRPVLSVALSFIALTNLGDGVVETLGSFLTNAPSTPSFSSADGSAAWAAGLVSPLDEDSRGVLGFTSNNAAGLTSLRFEHIQAAALQGVVINRIDFEVAAVPEPTTLGLFAGGLLAVAALRRRRRV